MSSTISNSLIHGDCLEVLKGIPSGSVDMVICDPPYGMTKNSWDKPLTLPPLWEQLHRVCKSNAAMVFFSQGIFTAKLMLSNEKDYRYSLVWEKNLPVGFLNANRRPLSAHEDICVFYRQQPVYFPIKRPGVRKVSKTPSLPSSNYSHYNKKDYDSDTRYPTSVLYFPKDNEGKGKHPTRKPVDLLRYLIMTYSSKDAVILDPCCGSGSTLIAAALEHRQYIGIEKDDRYYKEALEDIKKVENQPTFDFK